MLVRLEIMFYYKCKYQKYRDMHQCYMQDGGVILYLDTCTPTHLSNIKYSTSNKHVKIEIVAKDLIYRLNGLLIFVTAIVAHF